MPDFIESMRYHGLFHQATDEAGLRAHLSSGVRRGYVGYDPTSNSLTIGNLVTIMMLRQLQLAGHVPVVIAGGGTGLIGDPSGKSSERTLMTRDMVAANVESQMRIFGRILDFSAGASNRATLMNNLDWLGSISFLDALRDIGKFFSVNAMMAKDSVKDRLESREQGISYTEFSYMILQSYDWAHLYEHHGVTLQMGGSDQWGNITAGSDLIRKRWHAMNPDAADDVGPQVHALTAPLLTKADGTKFGKSESGAVWLTADRTSPYALYQYMLNSADADVPRLLKVLTTLPRDTIDGALATHAADPGRREAHALLAYTVTDTLHGKTEADNAVAAGKALFSGDIGNLPFATLNEIFASVPSSNHDKAQLGVGVPLLDMLVTTQLAKSRSEAKEFLSNGSVSVNGRKVALQDSLSSADLLHGEIIAIRRGKKNWHITRWR